MKHLIPLFLIFSYLLSACGALGAGKADATPTISAEDIRATADIMVYDMLTKTQAAMPPTNTLVPPTNTLLPTAISTTAVPTLALELDPLVTTPSAVAINTTIPTSTAAQTVVSCADQPFTTWSAGSTKMAVDNNVKDTTANVFLCGESEIGEIGYISIPVLKSNSVMIPQGCYSATAWVSGKKNFNDTITFCVLSDLSWKIVIEEGHIFLHGGCHPNC